MVFQSGNCHGGLCQRGCRVYNFDVWDSVTHGFICSGTKAVSNLLYNFVSAINFSRVLKFDNFHHCREFPVRLENPHVISSDQIWAGVIQTGPSGHSLNSSFRTRDSPEYKQDLGNTIGYIFGWNWLLIAVFVMPISTWLGHSENHFLLYSELCFSISISIQQWTLFLYVLFVMLLLYGFIFICAITYCSTSDV